MNEEKQIQQARAPQNAVPQHKEVKPIQYNIKEQGADQKESCNVPPSKILNAIQCLKKQGFENTEKSYQQLIINIKKINSDSILYEVTYGFWKTHISAFIFNLNFLQNLDRQCIGKGQFAIVERIKGTNIVAKKFIRKNRCLGVQEEIIKQIFMTKFAGALSVGPKFYKHNGYDVYSIGNKYQFFLEACSFSKQNSYKYQKDLLSNLALLHHFQFVHSDIKPDNILWNQKKQKFVFVDFGFSTFVQGLKGSKTISVFKGSFNYASSEMKKAFYLGQNQVDLYSNDFHALHKTIQEYRTTLSSPLFFRSINESAHSQNIDSRVEQICKSFFLLKYLVFHEQWSQAEHLVQKQEVLLHSFCKIVRKQWKQPIKAQLLQKLHSKISKIKSREQFQAFLDSDSIDAQLYKSISQQNEEILQNSDPSFQIITGLIDRNQLKLVWRRPNWMHKIFEYLLLGHSSKQPCLLNASFNLVQQISKIISEQCLKIDPILQYFQNYFFRVQNLTAIYQIFQVYRLLLNYNHAKRVKLLFLPLLVKKNKIFNSLWLVKNYLVQIALGPFHNIEICSQMLQLSKQYSESESQKRALSLISNLLSQITKFQEKRVNLEFNCFKSLQDKFKLMKEAISEPNTSNLIKTIEGLLNSYYSLIISKQSFLKNKIQSNSSPTRIHSAFPNQLCQNQLQSIFYEPTQNLLKLQDIYRLQNHQMKKKLISFLDKSTLLNQTDTIWFLPVLLSQNKIEQAKNAIRKYFENQEVSVFDILHIIPQIWRVLSISQEMILQYEQFMLKVSIIEPNIRIKSLIFSTLDSLDCLKHEISAQTLRKVCLISFAFFDRNKLKKINHKNQEQNDQIQLESIFRLNKIFSTLKQSSSQVQRCQTIKQLKLAFKSIQCQFGYTLVYLLLKTIKNFKIFCTENQHSSIIFCKLQTETNMRLFDELSNYKELRDFAVLTCRKQIYFFLITQFLKRGMHGALLKFILEFSKIFNKKKLRRMMLPVQDINFIFLQLPRREIKIFTESILVRQKLISVLNFKSTYFIFKIFNAVKGQICKNFQKRLIIMMALAIKNSSMSIQRKHEIEQIIWRWIRKNQRMWGRKKLINLKKQAKCHLNFSMANKFRSKLSFLDKRKDVICSEYQLKINKLKKICKQSP